MPVKIFPQPPPYIGGAITGATEGSVLIVGSDGVLAEFEGFADMGAVDLTGMFLAGSIFPNADWTSATNFPALTDGNLNGICWPGANLTGTTLTGGITFVAAVLIGANLTGADATGADFTNANLAGADLTNATMTNAILDSANLTNAILDGTTLTDADLTGALCEGANFTGAAMPTAADTKAEFKALVGAWNAVTTIWTDGNPIG